MFQRLAASCLALLGLTIWSLPASASSITYSATNTSGTEWRYDYVVTAEAAEAAIDEFTIYFDPPFAASANLRSLSLAGGWDGLIQQPDDLLPDHGLIDVFALDAGIAPGSSLSGFSVVFDWFGPGSPGSQAFDIIDAANFSVLRSGLTAPAVVAGVPEPGMTVLLALALAGLLARGRLLDRRIRPVCIAS